MHYIVYTILYISILLIIRGIYLSVDVTLFRYIQIEKKIEK
jgi:hypothetical protein